MGVYDDIRCKYPLPVEGANARSYQTKDTPVQWLDQYEIREDGTLWHEDYDLEDRSDPNAAAGSIDSFVGCMTRVNKRWEPVEGFTGEIRFYDILDGDGWLEFSSHFVGGKLQQLHLVEHRPPAPSTGDAARGERMVEAAMRLCGEG